MQGVGFRAYVRAKARKMDIYGWVRNLKDGRVEAVLQGDKEKIDKLIFFCNRGPFFAKVTDVVLDWEESEEKFSEFNKLNTL